MRSPPEVEQHGTIPGAININLRTLEETLALSQDDFENQVLKYLEIVDRYMYKKPSRLVFRARALIQVFWSSSAGELILFEKTFHFQGVDLGQLGQPGSLKLIGSGFPLFNLLC